LLNQEKEIESVNRQYPSFFRVAKAVGWVTFLEIIRDRILYNILICAFLLLSVGYLAARLSFLHPERILIDFGLAAVSLSCSGIGVLVGSTILIREFERRTAYVALCHPISRGQFLVGKFAGLIAVLSVNWALLSLAYLIILVFISGYGVGVVSATLFIALGLALLQSIVISTIALFFSTFSTTSLAIMISIGMYLIGNNISQIKLVAAHLKSPLEAFLLKGFATFLPNLEYFNLGTKVSYGLPVTFEFVALSILYAFAVVTFLLISAGFLIQGREV
jgi:ABC-type transport system involved in multi-copper enzyme maturation permease subunit